MSSPQNDIDFGAYGPTQDDVAKYIRLKVADVMSFLKYQFKVLFLRMRKVPQYRERGEKKNQWQKGGRGKKGGTLII